MLAQRGADLKQRALDTAAADKPKEVKGTAAPVASSAKRRLNFNEKHALETLPKTMAKLQAEIARQQKLLDDPELYAKDRKRFDAASAAIAKAQAELDDAEEKWLQLEMLREEIESGV
jgi:ATP-binding cassette subfamily F protein uup